MSEYAEIVFSCSDPAESRRIRRGLDSGKLRQLIRRVYTSNLQDEPAAIVRDNRLYLLWRLYPGALLSHRTALNLGAYRGANPYFARTGAVYLTYRYTERVEWPGMTVFLLKGPAPLATDIALDSTMPGLTVSSVPRALLENLQPSRRTDKGRKTVSRTDIVAWLRSELLRLGASPLYRLRSEAAKIAPELGMLREFAALDSAIAGVLKWNGWTNFTAKRTIARLLSRNAAPPDIDS